MDDARDKRHRDAPAGAFAPHGGGADAQLFSVNDWPQQHAGTGFLPSSAGYELQQQQNDSRYAAYPDAATHRPGEHELAALFPQQFSQYSVAYPPPYPLQQHLQSYHHHFPGPLSSQPSSGPDRHSSFMPSAMGGQAHYLPQDYYPPDPTGEVGGYYDGEWGNGASAHAGANTEYHHPYNPSGSSFSELPLFASPSDVQTAYEPSRPALLDGLAQVSASAYQLHYRQESPQSISPTIRSPSLHSPPPTSPYIPDAVSALTPTGLTRTRTFSAPTSASASHNSPDSSSSSTPKTSSSTHSTRTFRSDPTAALSVSAAAQAAAAHRSQLKASSPAPLTKKAPKRNPATPPPRKKGTKLSLEQACACRVCGVQFAVATLRGTAEDLDVKFSSVYLCLECAPKAPVPRVGILALEGTEGSEEFGTAYEYTLSGVVDRLEGLDLDHDPRPPPSTRSTAGKKRRAQEQELVCCDVCARDVGTGNLVPKDPKQRLTFGIEILCTTCEDKYRRCSDCGGGGGVRVGVGKWRCKELFPEARKTCQISHLRLGALHDMSYAVWPISELPPADVDTLVGLCRDLWTTTILATLATPETLESPLPIARTYEEVHKLAMDSWTMCEPYIRDDIEEAQLLRRYVALRWSVPAPRKRGKAASVKPIAALQQDDSDAPLIRTDGKQLAGFILGEFDMPGGSLFLPFTMPTGTGETFESTTILLQTLHKRVRGDLDATNQRRRSRGAHDFPPLTEAWTMRLYKKETRILTRRGYLGIDEYIKRNPEIDRSDYPPTRPVFLPPELLKGWDTFIKRLAPDDDWGHSRLATTGREGSRAKSSFDDY